MGRQLMSAQVGRGWVGWVGGGYKCVCMVMVGVGVGVGCHPSGELGGGGGRVG